MSLGHGSDSFSAEQAAKFKGRHQDFPPALASTWWMVQKDSGGAVYYFGRVTPDKALAKYDNNRPYLERGVFSPSENWH